MDNMDTLQERNGISNGFLSLPLDVQLHIFKLLNEKNAMNARMVCSTWLIIISKILRPFRRIFNNEELRTIKNSYYYLIYSLSFANLTINLPIYSSTRSLLPNSIVLILFSGNSNANVLKLLRYYAAHAKVLRLFGSLDTLKSYQINSGFGFQNIRELEFSTLQVCSSGGTNTPFDFKIQSLSSASNYIFMLAKFLESIQIEKLKTLTAQIWYSRSQEINDYITLLSQKICYSFKQFLIKHGRQLTTLNAWVRGEINFPIFESFQHVNNELENLEVWYNPGIETDHVAGPLRLHLNTYVKNALFLKLILKNQPEFLDTFIKALSFNKLKRCGISLFNPTRMSTRRDTDPPFIPLLKNNAIDLLSFIEYNPINTIDWLHSTKFSNLSYLQLFLTGLTNSQFEEVMAKKYTIETLKTLTLVLSERNQSLVKDWFDSTLDWIIQTAPNLRQLNMFIGNRFNLSIAETNKFQFEVSHMEKLIKKLKLLKYIKLHMEEWKVKPVAFSIEVWCNKTNGLFGIWKTSTRFYEKCTNFCCFAVRGWARRFRYSILVKRELMDPL